MTTTTIPVPQAVVDRGTDLFLGGQVRRRIRRGCYKIVGSTGTIYQVDIRGWIANVQDPQPLPSCQCDSVKYRGTVCKHIVAAMNHAINKGWI